jgi:bacteriocin-like protein
MQNLKTNAPKQQNQISEDELKKINGGMGSFTSGVQNNFIENAGQYASNYYFNNK